jgi:aminodeoxyfutalosine deaminase
VRAADDPALLAHLAAHRVACDLCPTSNVRLGLYRSIAAHPIRRLLDAGVPLTLATDNPPLFGATLTGEYLALARELDFNARELAALARNGVEASFLEAGEKAALRAGVDEGLARAAREAGLTA